MAPPADHDGPPTDDTTSMTLHLDLMSQPSRACAILRDLYLPQEQVAVKAVRLDKGQQREAAFAAVNPLKKVPFLQLGPGGLAESGAILPFLAASFPDRVPDNWRRPSCSSPLRAARHDAALLWTQASLRAGATRLVFHRVIGRLVFNTPTSADVAAHGAQVLLAAVAELEGAWLAGGGRKFIGHGAGAAGDAPSSADLLCLCELDQLELLDAADPGGGPCARDFVVPGGVVEAWRDRVRAAVGGEGGAYGRAVRTLRAAAARFEADRRRAQEAAGGGGASKL